MICFIPNGSDLKLAAFSKDATLTMSISKQGHADPFSISHATLKTFVGKRDADIILDPQTDSVHVRCGEEQKWIPREKHVNSLPNAPKPTVTHDKKILNALAAAARCTDQTNIRFALGGICLRGGTSQILATTGIQLLAQEGFHFPWKQDVLCPAAKIFGSKELQDTGTDAVLLGQADDWIYFAVGAVEFWLRIIAGSFPKTAQLLVPSEKATILDIAAGDAGFILDRLDKLPGKKEHESPIHLSLDTKVTLRAYDKEQSGTTLELSRSHYTGTNVTVACNRLFLKNALQFGFLQFRIDPPGKPLVCPGEDRTFVFMTFTPAEPEIDPAKMNVVTSATAQPVVATAAKASITPVQVKRRRRRVVKQDVVKPATSKAVLLQSAEQIRQDLRNSLIQVNTLIREVKAQRSKDKLIQNTMDSLRKLKPRVTFTLNH